MRFSKIHGVDCRQILIYWLAADIHDFIIGAGQHQ
jgi:hypothetical protein